LLLSGAFSIKKRRTKEQKTNNIKVSRGIRETQTASRGAGNSVEE